MKCNMTNEQIISVIKSAPSGSQFYTDGYDVKYRKVIGDKYFGYLDEAKGWVETCDKELSQERIDKGWWITNLIKVIESREPQTKEVKWVNGDECRYANDIDHDYIYIGEHPHGDGHYVFSEEKGITYIANGYLLEPETLEKKLEREELEAASYLLSDWFNAIGKDMPEWSSVNEDVKAHYLRIVRKTNYKVKGE